MHQRQIPISHLERVVCARQVAGHFGKGLLHETLHLKPLLLGDSGRETESVDAAANTDPRKVVRRGHLLNFIALAFYYWVSQCVYSANSQIRFVSIMQRCPGTFGSALTQK